MGARSTVEVHGDAFKAAEETVYNGELYRETGIQPFAAEPKDSREGGELWELFDELWDGSGGLAAEEKHRYVFSERRDV